jgi:hypothetical protein
MRAMTGTTAVTTANICYTPERTLLTADEQWEVYEIREHDYPHYGPALLFLSPGFGRRVRTYPSNWRELSDEDLYSLSWNR